MLVPGCAHCNKKGLRPKQCIVALDGKPCSACAEDIEVEQEIKGLGSCSDEIHAKRRSLRTVMNENHDHLIHKLPPEISSQIFIQYYAMSPKFEIHDKYDRKKLLYLGAVCQKWRQLAWSTPELWTSVSLGDRDIYRWSNRTEKLLIGWLERSGGLPLTIMFISSTLGDSDRYQGVANVLNKHSARWRNVHLAIPACHLHRLCGSLEGNTLRQLKLWCSDARHVSWFSTFTMKCKPSPMELTLKLLPLVYVDISWDNLTIVSVHEIGCDECFELIRRCPRLKSIELQAIFASRGNFPVPNARIRHTNLRSLVILRIHDQTMIAKILDSLCLPSLENWIQGFFFCPLDNMISFIDYSSFHLKMLKIDRNGNAYDQIHELLFHLPFLEHLELSNPSSYRYQPPPPDKLIDLLCASGGSPPFLPCLQTLKFGNFPITWESLPQIFASPNRRSLKVNIMHYSKYGDNAKITYKTIERLMEFVDEGFNLSILQGGRDVLEGCRERRRRSPGLIDLLMQPTYEMLGQV